MGALDPYFSSGLSSAVERHVYTVLVGGSIPSVRTEFSALRVHQIGGCRFGPDLEHGVADGANGWIV